MRKPLPIPAVETGNKPLDDFARASKATLDRFTAQDRNAAKLEQLPTLATTATLAETIDAYNALAAAVNVLIDRAGQ